MAAPPVPWVIQTNLGGTSDVRGLPAAVASLGHPVREVEVVPMSDDLPDVRHDGPVVAYASTGFVLRVRDAGLWIPGVWQDDAAFRWSAWAANYGDLLLNSPRDGARLATMGAVASGAEPPVVGPVFARPDRDAKEFDGDVWDSWADLARWCGTVAAGGADTVSAETEIVVGTAHGVEAEWRLFVCEGRVVGASRYRLRGRPSRERGAPPEEIAFGEAAAARWSPAPVFTLDVCRSGGGLWVVEAHGFNSAGLYAADQRAVAAAVSQRAAKEWLLSRSPAPGPR